MTWTAMRERAMASTQADLTVASSAGLSQPEEAVRELSRARREHDELVDSIDGIVWEADSCFRFLFVSQQAERLLGYPVRRWYLEPDFWLNHLHPEDREWAPAHCREATEACLPHEFEYRMI